MKIWIDILRLIWYMNYYYIFPFRIKILRIVTKESFFFFFLESFEFIHKSLYFYIFVYEI